MMRTAIGRIGALAGASLLATHVATGQQVLSMKRVFTADSVDIETAEVSPDGRWVLYGAKSPSGQRLWIAPTAGGEPWPLTSEGHTDRLGRWFPSGDQIVFTSTRPSRNGAQKQFAMVLDVDPRTGRPVGAPRQVTIEAARSAVGSPDGRWLAYSIRDTTLRVKLVPVGGGTPRLLAEIRDVASNRALRFDRSGANVYVSATGPDNETARHKLWRIPVNGGRPEVIVEADHPVHILPADPRFVIHYDNRRVPSQGPGSAALTTLDGRELARITIPRHMLVLDHSGDGWGFHGVMNRSKTEVRVVSVSGGEPRTLATGDNWPEAWMPDGSAVITDRPDGEGGDYVLEILPLSGGERKIIRLPGGLEFGGWLSSVGPYYSHRTRAGKLNTRGTWDTYSIDVRNGQTRLISRTAAGDIAVGGRAGFENDADRWVYAERVGDRVVIKSADPGTGASRTVRSFPSSLRTMAGFDVHGNRIAYLQQHGDSARLMMTEGEHAPARRLATLSLQGRAEIHAMMWSWSGNQIALLHGPVAGKPSTITIIEVPASDAAKAGRREIQVGFESYCCDVLQWLQDDSAVVGLGALSGSRTASILLVPLREGGQARVLAEAGAGWELLLSPDGKHVVYPVISPGSASVWVADFRSLVQGR